VRDRFPGATTYTRGYDCTFSTDKRGWQGVYVYAIDNNGKAQNPLLGTATINIS
jgi:hypothetical protein